MADPRQDSVKDLIRAVMRSVRAIGYYDPSHPVFRSSQVEAMRALAAVGDAEISLGCGGGHIVFDPESPPLTDDVSRSLAKCMFNRSLIAIRLSSAAPQVELAHLMRLLAESEDRLRAAGGMTGLLAAEGCTHVRAVEVDYAELFAGEEANITRLVGNDPVVERALREVLRFKTVGEGQTLSIRLDELNTADSLGGFLDELIGKSEAAVTREGAAANGRVDEIPIESFGDLASAAFFENQKLIKRSGSSRADLVKSARFLGDALIRLSPSARIALLRRLAGAEEALSPDEQEAVGELGKNLDGNLIVDTIASALLQKQGEAEAVNAIGNLIRRLRPLEKDRLEILDRVDRKMGQGGQRADGLVWQSIQAKALEREELGYLKVAFDQVKDRLAHAAELRRRNRLAPVPGQDILLQKAEELIDRQAAVVLDRVLNEAKTVGASVVIATRSLIEKLEASGEIDTSTGLLAALVRRADLEEPTTSRRTRAPESSSPPARRSTLPARPGMTPTEPLLGFAVSDGIQARYSTLGPMDPDAGVTARVAVSELLSGPAGGERTVRLASAGVAQGSVMGEVLLEAIEASRDPKHQEVLFEKLTAIDPRLLERIALSGGAETKIRFSFLVRALAGPDPKAALKVVRHALRSPLAEMQEAAIRALISIPDPSSLGLLQVVSGVKGDEQAQKLLNLPASDEALLMRMKRVAIGALGLSRSPYAVPTLVALLTRPSGGLFANKQIEELRVDAAHALLTNGTPDAKRALAEGAESKKKPIRDAALRALRGFDG